MVTVWKDRDNGFAFQLKKTDANGVLTALTSAEMDDISKIEILYKGVYYDSATYATSFDWSTYKASGVVVFKLGLIATITIGRDKRAELIIYNTANPLGIVWKQLDIKVMAVA